MEQAIKNNSGKKSLLFNTVGLLLAVFLAPKFLGALAALVIGYLVWPGYSNSVWEVSAYATMVISAMLMYVFVFWLAKQYIGKGFFGDKKFYRNFLILVAIFFILNFDFSISLCIFLVLIFYIQQPQLLSLKNSAYQPYLKIIYKLYLVSLGLAIIGNIFYLVFSLLGQNTGHDYLAWMLVPRFTAPFFILLMYVIFLALQNKTEALTLSRAKYVFYSLAILVSGIVGAIIVFLSFVSMFALGILGESFVWLAMVLTFVACFVLLYNLAYWLLRAKVTEAWWQYYLKLIANLFFIPIGLAILWDFIMIVIVTTVNAFSWKDQFVIPVLVHPLAFVYAALILIYFLKYKKDLKQNQLRMVLSYLVIICFILSALESVIRIDLSPPFI